MVPWGCPCSGGSGSRPCGRCGCRRWACRRGTPSCRRRCTWWSSPGRRSPWPSSSSATTHSAYRGEAARGILWCSRTLNSPAGLVLLLIDGYMGTGNCGVVGGGELQPGIDTASRTQHSLWGRRGAGNVVGVSLSGREWGESEHTRRGSVLHEWEWGGGNGGVVVVEICGVAKQNQAQVRTDGDKKGGRKQFATIIREREKDKRARGREWEMCDVSHVFRAGE